VFDLPWVTFDGKVLTQRYRPRVEERIEFNDPVTGRKIQNIYGAAAEDGKLLGKASINDAGAGFGVNGNHSNDATLVRQFHLWGRKKNIPTATIHDAFFTNISVANQARSALRTIYADALQGDTVRKTLKEMRKRGLPRKAYLELLAEATQLGLIDPPNKITRRDILAPLKEGQDWYGIGP
jgi:DNA-directed RNA polymerase